MTERERWIVYPLLFLALGAALRDKLFNTTMSRSIVCQELVVVDEGKYPNERTPVVRIGAAPVSAGRARVGQIEVSGTINADGYFVAGAPMSSPARTIVPGISLQDFYRALQQATQQQQGGATPNVPAVPRQPSPNAGSNGADGTPSTTTAPNEPSQESAPTPPPEDQTPVEE